MDVDVPELSVMDVGVPELSWMWTCRNCHGRGRAGIVMDVDVDVSEIVVGMDVSEIVMAGRGSAGKF
jgi:hypothetical protein